MEEQNKTNEDQCTPSKIAYFHNEYDWSNGVKKTQEQNAKQTLVR